MANKIYYIFECVNISTYVPLKMWYKTDAKSKVENLAALFLRRTVAALLI